MRASPIGTGPRVKVGVKCISFQSFPKLINFFFFLAVLSLHCCVWTFSSCSELWLPFVAVLRLLTAVAALLEEHRLEGTWAQ